MYGQLKVKPEMEKLIAPYFLVWKEEVYIDDKQQCNQTISFDDEISSTVSSTHQRTTSGRGTTRWPTATTFNELQLRPLTLNTINDY